MEGVRSHSCRQLCLYDPHNIAYRLHLHNVIDIEIDTQSLFQIAHQEKMASRIPAGYVVRTGFKGDRLRIDTEGIVESALHFGQNILHSFVSSNRGTTRDFHRLTAVGSRLSGAMPSVVSLAKSTTWEV